MMHYAGTLALSGLVAYVAYNAEKVMIGRFWGAEAIGIYGRAQQLSIFPRQSEFSTADYDCLCSFC